jgi:TetR/AcrR family transcriptional regulator, cholesterol catabolism regulator
VNQEELLRVAEELFADRGYAATTVRDIAEAAGILSGSLYHHIDSKESIMDAILSRFIDRALAAYEAVTAEGRGPMETFEALVRTSLESMVDSRAAIVVYQNEARLLAAEPRFAYLADAQRKFEKVWTTVLEDGVASGDFRPTIDPKLVYRLVRDSVWTAPRWYRPAGPLNPDRIIAQYTAVLTHGVRRC